MEIKELREKAKLTQMQLAESLRVPAETVRDWENNKARPSLAMQRKIGRLEKKLAKKRYCVNGDGNLVCPPSKVLCQECQDKITAKLKEILQQLKEDNRMLQEALERGNEGI